MLLILGPRFGQHGSKALCVYTEFSHSCLEQVLTPCTDEEIEVKRIYPILSCSHKSSDSAFFPPAILQLHSSYNYLIYLFFLINLFILFIYFWLCWVFVAASPHHCVFIHCGPEHLNCIYVSVSSIWPGSFLGCVPAPTWCAGKMVMGQMNG